MSQQLHSHSPPAGSPFAQTLAHLFALDALICCVRAGRAEASDRHFAMAAALAAVQIAWETASLAEKRNRIKPNSIEELMALMHRPTRLWLPHADSFGPVVFQGILEDENRNPNYLDALEHLGVRGANGA